MADVHVFGGDSMSADWDGDWLGRIVTTNSKVTAILGMQGTRDVSEWEEGFLRSIDATTRSGKDMSKLSDKQRDVIDRIYKKHFA